MTKKGKFKLTSCLIENQLIFFKSKAPKIIAFAVILTSNYREILPILTNMLRKSYFDYFSWQIGIKKDRKDFFIISIRDSKAGIIKAFHLIKKELNDYNIKKIYLENEALRKAFFELLSQDVQSQIFLDKSSHSIIIKNSNVTRKLGVFQLNLAYLNEQENTISNLINYLNDLGKNIVVYFNFHTNYLNSISYNGIMIEEINQKCDMLDLDKQVNKFFNWDLLAKIKIKLNQALLILWRKSLQSSNLSCEIPRSFFKENKFDLSANELLAKLNKHQIKYHQLSDNTLFIENHIIFILIKKMDLKYLLHIFKKFYEKYKIILLFLNEQDYHKFLNIEQITKLNELKILRTDDLVKFNYKDLKNI